MFISYICSIHNNNWQIVYSVWMIWACFHFVIFKWFHFVICKCFNFVISKLFHFVIFKWFHFVISKWFHFVISTLFHFVISKWFHFVILKWYHFVISKWFFLSKIDRNYKSKLKSIKCCRIWVSMQCLPHSSPPVWICLGSFAEVPCM